MPHDVDRRGDLDRQIREVRKEANARIQRGQDAMIQLAKAREQLLALSLLIHRQIAHESECASHEVAAALSPFPKMLRDIRANQTVAELEQIK